MPRESDARGAAAPEISRNAEVGARLRELLGDRLSSASAVGVQLLILAADAYVGTELRRAREDDESPPEGEITPGMTLRAAAAKLLFEVAQLGEHGATDAATKDGSFQLARAGRSPDLSLATLAVAYRSYQTRQQGRAEQTTAESTAQRAGSTRAYRNVKRASYYAEREPMKSTSSTSSGCGCGGSKPAARPAPRVAPTRASSCGCESCRPVAAAPVTAMTRTRVCAPWTPSCETQDRLREAVKDSLCDFLRCLGDTFCPDGKFDPQRLEDDTLGDELAGCVGNLACALIHRVPDALCPTPSSGCDDAVDVLPCDYAVEESR